MIGVYKVETAVMDGTGRFERTGIGSHRGARENLNTAFNYFRVNSKNISASLSTKTKDYLLHVQDMQGVGLTSNLALTALIALTSAALGKPAQEQLVILGSMSIGGSFSRYLNLPMFYRSALMLVPNVFCCRGFLQKILPRQLQNFSPSSKLPFSKM